MQGDAGKKLHFQMGSLTQQLFPPQIIHPIFEWERIAPPNPMMPPDRPVYALASLLVFLGHGALAPADALPDVPAATCLLPALDPVAPVPMLGGAGSSLEWGK